MRVRCVLLLLLSLWFKLNFVRFKGEPTRNKYIHLPHINQHCWWYPLIRIDINSCYQNDDAQHATVFFSLVIHLIWHLNEWRYQKWLHAISIKTGVYLDAFGFWIWANIVLLDVQSSSQSVGTGNRHSDSNYTKAIFDLFPFDVKSVTVHRDGTRAAWADYKFVSGPIDRTPKVCPTLH